MESHGKAICLQNDVLKIEENNRQVRNGLQFQEKKYTSTYFMHYKAGKRVK